MKKTIILLPALIIFCASCAADKPAALLNPRNLFEFFNYSPVLNEDLNYIMERPRPALPEPAEWRSHPVCPYMHKNFKRHSVCPRFAAVDDEFFRPADTGLTARRRAHFSHPKPSTKARTIYSERKWESVLYQPARERRAARCSCCTASGNREEQFSRSAYEYDERGNRIESLWHIGSSPFDLHDPSGDARQ